jgi:hypothetical protein
MAVPNDQSGLDPQLNYTYSGWELFRCCLLRTPLSYNGRSWERGGAELRPDLAAAPPTVSGGERIWTFHLRSSIRYPPPFQAKRSPIQT